MPGSNTEVDSSVELNDLDSAAEAIESLLSDEEDQQPDAAPADDAEETPAPADDSEGEEPAEPAEEPSESDEPAEEADDAPITTTYKTKVSGQDVEVTLEEALKGYSRTQDYTRKTQELAEERKSFGGEKEAVRAERQKYATRLGELENVIKAQEQEPDWDKLREEDPAVFAATHAAWQVHEKRMQVLATERAAAQAKVDADDAEAYREHVKAERAKLAERLPEWDDEKKGPAFRKELRAYGQESGFTTAELSETTDHRALVILHKAMLYDKAQAAKATAEPKAKQKIDALKAVPPGAKAKAKAQTSELTRRKQRLAQTGRVEDAAAAIELLL